jgi:hypothetical protein
LNLINPASVPVSNDTAVNNNGLGSVRFPDGSVINDVQLWLDFTNEALYTLSGSNIVQVDDISGYDRHAAASAVDLGGTMEQLVYGIHSGAVLPAGHMLTCGSVSDFKFLSNGTTAMIYIVAKRNDSAVTEHYWFWTTDGGAVNGSRLSITDQEASYVTKNGAGLGTLDNTVTSGTVTDEFFNKLILIFRGLSVAGVDKELFINDLSTAIDSADGLTAVINSGNTEYPFRIGGFGTTDMTICEIGLISPALADIAGYKTILNDYTNFKYRFDNDSMLYINALRDAGYIMTDAEKLAWNQTILTKKADGTWYQDILIYPMKGATAATHAINARNPGTYTITWYGTWVHSATGALPDGIDAWADTGFNPSGILDFSSICLAFYSGTIASVNNGVDIGSSLLGVYNHIYANFSGDAYFESPAGGMISAAPVNTGGLFTGSRTSISAAIFKRNKTTLGTNATDYTGALIPNQNIHISNDGDGDEFSDRECRWASVSLEYSSAQIDSNYDAVQLWQTSCGRAV